jgi:hypothetical protein
VAQERQRGAVGWARRADELLIAVEDSSQR